MKDFIQYVYMHVYTPVFHYYSEEQYSELDTVN